MGNSEFAKAPPCPKHFDKEQRAVWRQLTASLKKLGVVRETDTNALERYCVLWVRWRRASVYIEKNGETYVLKDKENKPRCAMQWPQVGIINRLSILLLRLEQEFGLTPAARASIDVEVSSHKTNDAMGGLGIISYKDAVG